MKEGDAYLLDVGEYILLIVGASLSPQGHDPPLSNEEEEWEEEGGTRDHHGNDTYEAKRNVSET